MRLWLIAAATCVAAAKVLSAQQLPPAARDTARADSSKAARALNAMVVTASRRLQRVSDAPVTTEVISRAEIEKSGAQDLNSLLTQYVGVQPEAGVAGSGGVSIEGLSSEHVLLLIDGQPMVGRIDGELDISRVPAWMIDHVEVIKGPLSTLYGSSAMGGVINVITRDIYIKRPAVNATVIGGSQGRVDANAAVRGGTDDVKAMLGFGRRQDNIQPGRSDQSGARANRWDGNGRLRWSPTGSLFSIDATGLGVREDQRWQSGLLYFFSNNDQADARITVDAPLDSSRTRRFGATAYYSQFHHLSRQSTLAEPVTDSGDASTESLARMEATYSGQTVAGQVVDLGVDVDRMALTASRIIGGHRTSTSAEPFAQYTIETGRLSIVPGARLSYSDQWGTHFTPKLATLVRLGDGFSLRASAGAGYRAPDFKELYITFLNANVGYVVHGNPDLKPESSINETVGLQWEGQSSYVRVQGYTNRFTQFIESVSLPDSGNVQQFSYSNVADGVTRGVDFDAGWTYKRLSLDGSYGYLDAYDRSTHLQLLGTTPRQARLTADLRLPMRVRSSVTGLYWSKSPASQTTTGAMTSTVYRGDFTRVDARLARPFKGGVEAQLGVQNLFDARPIAWPGTTARRWYVGASINQQF
ncbi:MAG TPA: TonB-dependent receptor [Gemmatimonadaceae bacterium]|jgi:outer membrane receptor for ferrienterochelin and colicins